MEQQLSNFLTQYGYAFIVILTFLECGAFTGLFVPGESLLILSGVLASQGKLSLALVIACAAVGAYGGDLFGYWLGHRFGRRVILVIAGKLGFHPDHFIRTEKFFDRYGALAIIGGRFIGIFRSLLPATAGLIEYPFRRFLAVDALGSLLWATFFTLVGYLVGHEWARYQPYFIGAGIVVVLSTILWNKVKRSAKTRTENGAAMNDGSTQRKEE